MYFLALIELKLSDLFYTLCKVTAIMYTSYVYVYLVLLRVRSICLTTSESYDGVLEVQISATLSDRLRQGSFENDYREGQVVCIFKGHSLI